MGAHPFPGPIHLVTTWPLGQGPIHPEGPWELIHAQGPSMQRAHLYLRPMYPEGPWVPIHSQVLYFRGPIHPKGPWGPISVPGPSMPRTPLFPGPIHAQGLSMLRTYNCPRPIHPEDPYGPIYT